MASVIPFATQAPQLTPWPDPVFTARDPAATWATYVPRLFVNSTYLARFRANWADPFWSRLVTAYSGGTSALTYLATGNTAAVTTAYNNAIAQTYKLEAGADSNCYTDQAMFVLDWMWPALTSTQRTNLIAKIEANTNTRKTALNSIFGLHESHLQGFHAWLFGGIAIQGEAGTTERTSQLKCAVQNYEWWLAEQNSGFWTSYIYQLFMLFSVETVWECATGQNIVALSGAPSYLANRYENYIRNCPPTLGTTTGHLNATGMGNQYRMNAAGLQYKTDTAYMMAWAGGFRNLPVANWLANALTAGGTLNWNNPWNALETTEPVWAAMMYWTPSLTQTPPSSGLPLCRSFPNVGYDWGWVAFRDGWNLTAGSTDIIAQFYGAYAGPHPEPAPGHLAIQRGVDDLLACGGGYTGSPSLIYDAWTSYSFHNNCAVFSPAGSATPDKSGSATLDRRNTLSISTFPASANLSSSGTSASTFVKSKLVRFAESASEHYADTDHSLAYPVALDPLTYHRHVSFVPALKAFVVRDVYQLANPGRNRFNWWGKALPVASGGKAVITRGSSQATIQCLDPAATLTIFGGPGNEQVIDGVSWPIVAANTQGATPGGIPVANIAAALAGQGRATFEVPSTATETVHVITVDAAGTTAPTYTLPQLWALAPMAFGIIPIDGLTLQGDTMPNSVTVGVPQKFKANFTSAGAAVVPVAQVAFTSADPTKVTVAPVAGTFDQFLATPLAANSNGSPVSVAVHCILAGSPTYSPFSGDGNLAVNSQLVDLVTLTVVP